MTSTRSRFLAEWPVHLLVWTLLLIKDVLAMYGAPAYQVPKTAVATYWLLGLGYLFISMTAFYLPVLLVARPLLTRTLNWRAVGRAAAGMLLALLLITGVRYGLEFHVFKPLLGFDSYHRNTTFTAQWFVQNSVQYYFDYALYGLLYAVIRHHLLAEQRRRATEQANTTAELTFLRSQVPALRLAGSSENPVEALSWIAEQRIELVFLDIQMPQLTGLQFMQALDRRAQVVLTTAYAEYALTGFEHDVVDYLLKPIPFERFYQAVQKAQRRLRPASADTARPYLFVKTEHRLQRVDLAEIRYLEGLQNYVLIHTATEKIMARQTINSLEASLPVSAFVRVHKSFIVALAHIHTVERGRIFLQAATGLPITIPVGDTYRSAFYGKL